MTEARVNSLIKEAQELKGLIGAKDFQEAVEKAIKFTMLHDKDSVQEALKT